MTGKKKLGGNWLSLPSSVINIMGKCEESHSKQTEGADSPCTREKDVKDFESLQKISSQAPGRLQNM